MNQKVQQAKESVWSFLNSKAGFGILCAMLATGGTAYIPKLLGLQGPAPAMSQMQTPMACARAMQEMKEAMSALKSTVEGQDKRIQDLTTSVREGFTSANQRIDNLLLSGKFAGKRSALPYDRATAKDRLQALLQPLHLSAADELKAFQPAIDRQNLDQLVDKAAGRGDVVKLNDAESRIR